MFSPLHYTGRRRRKLLIVSFACVLFVFLAGHLLGPRLLDDDEKYHPAVLTGGHPIHFPVYFDNRKYDITPVDKTIMYSWRKKHEKKGVFKYQLGTSLEPLETRNLGDEFRMVVQQAVGRSKKRKLNKIIKSVKEPFNKKGFHFFKVKGREVIGKLSATGGRFIELNVGKNEENELKNFMEKDQTVVLINANPFAAFHILIVPQIGLGLSQILTHSSLSMAVGFAETCSRKLKLVYNSIGAGASVNHHHWQGFYLKTDLPIEKAPTKQLLIADGVIIREVKQWPIRSYRLSSDSKIKLIDAAYRIVKELLEKNIAHNLLVTDKGNSVVIVPRKIGNYPDVSRKQVAAMEVLGFWIIPNEEEYTSLTPKEAHSFLAGAKPDIDFDLVQLFK